MSSDYTSKGITQMKDLSQKSIEKSKKMWNTILNFLKSTGLDILLFIIILAIVIHRGLLFLIHLNIEKYKNIKIKKTKNKKELIS